VLAAFDRAASAVLVWQLFARAAFPAAILDFAANFKLQLCPCFSSGAATIGLPTFKPNYTVT
jgi:hypothetical protein